LWSSKLFVQHFTWNHTVALHVKGPRNLNHYLLLN